MSDDGGVRLSEAEVETLANLFGYVPEPEPLEAMLAAVERILTARLDAVRAERDAAVGAVERVRRRHPRGDEETSGLAPGLWCPGCGEPRTGNGWGSCRDRRALDGGSDD